MPNCRVPTPTPTVHPAPRAQNLLLNFTAGGFVYVATVDVLPALLQKPSSALQTVAELGAFFAGVGMMLLVMAFEAGH